MSSGSGESGALPKPEAAAADEVAAADSIAAEEEGEAPVALAPSWYYWIFAASGFAGLIYESIWARYLKLFLGHAAYAQALVLGIFLFGLAAGAALCARHSAALRRPLLWYAGIEIVVALTAVYFHDIFVAAQGWAVSSVLPQIESDAAAELFKWALAAMLILPQSILLGATFPLMSAGVMRIWREQRGEVIAMLYFSNSLGAVLGVLASGFVLIPLAGLPGTVMIAGLISTVAAAAVWVLGHLFDDTGDSIEPAPAAAPAESAAGAPDSSHARLAALLTFIAFGTGLASFVYEIVWIRMLSLLLGSATHTFEIMLAAFILGLALGGLAVRRRAGAASGGELLGYLGKVQLAMGALALWSLFCFPWFYEILKEALRVIPRDDEGYLQYTALGFGLSMLMMLPATFCAGMTLPLLTKRLLDSGGERAIGGVYAANTLGAITGVFIAVYFLLPLAGMQWALLLAALVDMLLGVALVGMVARQRIAAALSFTVVALAAGAGGGRIDLKIASAGVYRQQRDVLPEEVLYYRDGRTASIAVVESGADSMEYPMRYIKTNGKTDAAIISGGKPSENNYSRDEMSMVMMGLLPLLYMPDAERVMNIGFGAGLTSRTLLLSPGVKRLDNVEIEAAVIEGARFLGDRVAAPFEDPRNHFIVNDAKSVMARAPQPYDAIVSEPSNPWISGVANLFTREFYQQVRNALRDDGVFVQWVQLYETEPRLVASVAQAMGEVFGDFAVYTVRTDMMFVATKGKALPIPSGALLAGEKARAFLSEYQLDTAEKIRALALGDRKLLLPYFKSFNAPVNSDYHPYLENNAHQAFFKKSQYYLNGISFLPVPVLELMGYPPAFGGDVQMPEYMLVVGLIAKAKMHYAQRRQEGKRIQLLLDSLAAQACPMQAAARGGDADSDSVASGYLEEISDLTAHLMPVLDKAQMKEIWQLLAQDDCIGQLLRYGGGDNAAASYVQFWEAVSLRDTRKLVETTAALLPVIDVQAPSGQMVVLAAMAAHYKEGNYQNVLQLMLNMPLVFPDIHHAARLLAAHAAEKV